MMIRMAYTGLCLLSTFCRKGMRPVLKRQKTTSVSDDSVLVGSIGEISLIGVNRPDSRNSIDISTAKRLKEAFFNFESNNNMTVAVLYGVGGNFSSGFDYKELCNRNTMELEAWLNCNKSSLGVTKMMTKKPVIAAINGYAIGAGMELALWCDLRVVEETAIMGLLSRRFGSPMVDGGSYRLPKLIGLSRALDLVLTGRQINGKEALEMGLANRLVACGSALGQAVNLANSLIKFPQRCIENDRNNLYYSTFQSTCAEDALDNELEGSMKLLDNEVKEGAKKFVDGLGRHGKFHLDNSKKKTFSV